MESFAESRPSQASTRGYKPIGTLARYNRREAQSRAWTIGRFDIRCLNSIRPLI